MEVCSVTIVNIISTNARQSVKLGTVLAFFFPYSIHFCEKKMFANRSIYYVSCRVSAFATSRSFASVDVTKDMETSKKLWFENYGLNENLIKREIWLVFEIFLI